MKFTLHGEKAERLVGVGRTRGFGGSSRKVFLAADQTSRSDMLRLRILRKQEPYSAKTKRLLADIAQEGGGDVAQAATGDPAGDPPKVGKARDSLTCKVRYTTKSCESAARNRCQESARAR